MKINGCTKCVSLFLFLALFLSLLSMKAADAQATENLPKGTGPVVLYEVYGGGGQGEDVYSYDYVVLKNITDAPIDLAGWTIQVATPTGSFGNGTSHTLRGQIEGRAYYFIKGATQTSNPNKPFPDFVTVQDEFNNLNIGPSDYKVALARSEDIVNQSTDAHVVDF